MDRSRAAALGALHVLLFGVSYVALQALGLKLAFEPAVVAVFWPAAGFAIGVLSRISIRRWPAYLVCLSLVNTVGNLQHGHGWGLSLMFMAANLLESMVGAWLLSRGAAGSAVYGSPIWLTRRFLPAAVLAPALGASLGAAALLGTGAASGLSFASAWWVWFAADALGVLAVLPAVDALADLRWLRDWRPQHAAEAVLLLTIEGTLAWVVFTTSSTVAQQWHWPFVTILGILWAVVRFGPRFTALMAAVLTVIVVWGSAHGGGPFAQSPQVNDPMLLVQGFCLVMFVSSLFLAHEFAGRENAERVMREQSAAMSLAVEGIAYVDPNGRYLRVNQAYAATLGTVPEQLIGSPWAATIHPDERGPFMAADYALMLENGRSSSDVRGLRADGSSVHLEITLIAEWDNDGTPRGHHCFVQDISIRRAATQQLDRFFDLSEDLLCVIGPDGRFQRVNPAWTRILGHSVEALAFKAFTDLVHPDDLAASLGAMDRVQQHAGAEVFENRYRCQDGSYRWLHWTSVKDTASDLIYGVAHDITVSRETGQALAEARDRALEASRLKSQFLATMSHEIRTPMNGVIGLSDLLTITELNSDQEQYVEGIRTAGAGLLNVINDVLDFSKIEAGAVVLDDIDFDLSTLVTEATVLISQTAKRKGLHLNTAIDPVLPAVLRGDPGRLRQVLINLAGNAVKFTDQGQITITLTPIITTTAEVGAADSEERVWVHLTVADTGIGMDQMALTRVFDPFAQADASTTRVYGGTGLGLAISHQIVEAMGGTISVTSQPGIGTTFSVTVPLSTKTGTRREDATLHSRPPEVRTRALTVPLREPGGVHSGRILLVEDNKVNQLVASRMLRHLGYEADVADDGVQALELAADHPYQVILMDCQMPRMDGFTATRRLRERPATAEIPIIAITANVFTEDRERCLAAGMDDYLPKPIRVEELDVLLRRWIEPGAAAISAPPNAEPGTETETGPPDPALHGIVRPRSGSDTERDSPAVDRSILEAVLRDMGDTTESARQEVIDDYLAQAIPWIADLEEAVAGDDVQRVRDITHTMKSSSALIGAQALAELLSTAHRIVLEIEATDQVPMAAIKAEFYQVSIALGQAPVPTATASPSGSP